MIADVPCARRSCGEVELVKGELKFLLWAGGILLFLMAAAVGSSLPNKGRELTEREKVDRAAQRLEHYEHCRDYPTSWDCR